MDKKTILLIIEWGIALSACAYLVYKLVTYDDYAGFGASLCAMSWRQGAAMALCVALMPLNMTLEAWRWKTLVPMSWREAHRQVYYSKLAGLVTPWRLGEYPARALLRNEWAQTLSMGAVGSATMTAAIVTGGICGLACEWMSGSVAMVTGWSYIVTVVVVLLILAAALYLAPRLLRRWAEVSHRLVVISLGQSWVRLLCWCVQLALVLYALDAYRSPVTHYELPVYYLLVTVTPNVPIVEAGVRGGLAITLFGTMNAAVAGVMLWVINTLMPCVSWIFMRKMKN